MKTIPFILAASIVFASTVFAQSQDETSKENKEMKQEQMKTQAKEETKLEGFVDTDGDGIDDRKVETNESKQGEGKKMRMRKRDHFIDADGDGINDSRCNGFGLQRKGKGRKRGGTE